MPNKFIHSNFTYLGYVCCFHWFALSLGGEIRIIGEVNHGSRLSVLEMFFLKELHLEGPNNFHFSWGKVGCSWYLSPVDKMIRRALVDDDDNCTVSIDYK